MVHSIKIGQVITSHQIDELSKKDTKQRCYQAALGFLSYRPRSVSEVRKRLIQKKFTREDTEYTIKRFLELGLLDDYSFAQTWVENRNSFAPRSRRLVHIELQRKGVSPDIASQTAQGIDELDAARRAAAKKAKGLKGLDKDTVYTKLSSFLLRRGFGWEITKKVVEETQIAALQANLPDNIY